MRNRNKPFFYRKKSNAGKKFVLFMLVGTLVFIVWGLSIPKIRQIIIHPLYAVYSWGRIFGTEFLHLTIVNTDDSAPNYAQMVYPTLQLPDRDVLFAESIEDIELNEDPLAEFRSTPVPEGQINAAQWVYLEEYDPETYGSAGTEAFEFAELLPPVFERADLNNDGPCALSAVLRFWGKEENQYRIASQIKPARTQLSVPSEALLRYVTDNYADLSGIRRINGNPKLLRNLISGGYPVIVPLESHAVFPLFPGDDMLRRVFVPVTGFNTEDKSYILQDPMGGASRAIDEETFLREWYAYLREYILIYPTAEQDAVFDILGEDRSESRNNNAALQKFKTDVELLPENPYAHLGYAYTLMNSGSLGEAYDIFMRARELGIPTCYLQYDSSLLETLFNLGYADDLVGICDNELKYLPTNAEILCRRAWGWLLKEDIPAAERDIQAALRIDPDNPNVRYAQRYLESLTN